MNGGDEKNLPYPIAFPAILNINYYRLLFDFGYVNLFYIFHIENCCVSASLDWTLRPLAVVTIIDLPVGRGRIELRHSGIRLLPCPSGMEVSPAGPNFHSRERNAVTTQVTRPPGAMAGKKVYAQGVCPSHTPFFR